MYRKNAFLQAGPEQENLPRLQLEELRAFIKAGIDSGPGIPAEEVFVELEAKYQAMADDQTSSDSGA